LKILNIVGARPNFMKIAPIMEAMNKKPGVTPVLLHTGQHYDKKMSKLFFEELGIPRPDINLEIGSASHAEQTGRVMIAFEKSLLSIKPDITVVVGDVNSTIACAMVSVKLGIPVAHVEAGLRSFDRDMPEEINRILTDSISSYLFVTEESGMKNLANEGVSKEKVHFVGNVMIDTLLKHKKRAEKSKICEELGVERGKYAVVTLHRPSNVDSLSGWNNIIPMLERMSEKIKTVFPIHPRTIGSLKELGLFEVVQGMGNIKIVPPFGYLDFLKLMSDSKLVVTDSGGMQEETTVLGVPCITMRENTERPSTVAIGTNTIVGQNSEMAMEYVQKILTGKYKEGKTPPLWDGKAAERIVDILTSNI